MQLPSLSFAVLETFKDESPLFAVVCFMGSSWRESISRMQGYCAFVLAGLDEDAEQAKDPL